MEWEMVGFYEFIPSGVHSVTSLTASHSDIAGLMSQKNPNNNGRSVKNTPNQSQNSKKNKRRRARNQNGRKPTATRTVPKTIVRDCTRHYLGVLTDPFGYFYNGVEVCIPDNDVRPSFKVQTMARGQFQAGETTGFGYVVGSPFIFSNNTPALLYTTSSFVGSAIDNVVAAGNVAVNLTQLPYSAASPRGSRLVGYGLRARYVGTELDRNGQVAVAVASDTEDSLHGQTWVGLLARPDTKVYPMDRQWKTVAWRPIESSQTAWGKESFTVEDVGNMRICVATQAATTGTEHALTMEWEMVGFYEFIPSGVHSVTSLTASHSDIAGISAIRSYLGSLWSSDAGQSLYKKGVDYLYLYLSNSAIPLLQYGVGRQQMLQY
jgi:hypothetical protein